jgi:hypothetical protein
VVFGAGLVSIEREDANADPDHPGGCGARALRLQRQSGGQSLVAEGGKLKGDGFVTSTLAPGVVAGPYFPD